MEESGSPSEKLQILWSGGRFEVAFRAHLAALFSNRKNPRGADSDKAHAAAYHAGLVDIFNSHQSHLSPALLRSVTYSKVPEARTQRLIDVTSRLLNPALGVRITPVRLSLCGIYLCLAIPAPFSSESWMVVHVNSVPPSPALNLSQPCGSHILLVRRVDINSSSGPLIPLVSL